MLLLLFLPTITNKRRTTHLFIEAYFVKELRKQAEVIKICFECGECEL